MMEGFKNTPLGEIPNSLEVKTLNEITKVYDGTHQTPKYVEEGVPFYSVEHVTANDFTNTKFVTKEVFDKENRRVKSGFHNIRSFLPRNMILKHHLNRNFPKAWSIGYCSDQ